MGFFLHRRQMGVNLHNLVLKGKNPPKRKILSLNTQPSLIQRHHV